MDNQQVSLDNLFEIKVLRGYFHDGLGNIYSLSKNGHIRKLTLIPHGGKTRKTYYRVKAAGKLWMVHHLVLMEKYNRFLQKHESGNHLDGDPSNNSADNLEIATHAEQVAHAVRNGLYCSGKEWQLARGLLKS